MFAENVAQVRAIKLDIISSMAKADTYVTSSDMDDMWMDLKINPCHICYTRPIETEVYLPKSLSSTCCIVTMSNGAEWIVAEKF